MHPIEANELTKAYGSVIGVDSLSFHVESGEVFGFLGPNGAGKTTFIRLLLGLISPTAGTASVLGADVRDEAALIDAKRQIGYLPANLGFDPGATGEDVLDYHGAVKGDSRRQDLLAMFSPPIDRPIREYSTGNKQMLGLVQAFMHDPDLVIMDEPTSGLDPLKQERFHEFIRTERDRGTTVFFSSHVLSEVRRVCDRVGILREGSLVALEDIDTLLAQGGKRVHLRATEDVHDRIRSLDGAFDLDTVGHELHFTYAGGYNELLDRLAGFDILDIEITEPPLEDVFMHYYGDDTGTDDPATKPEDVDA